MDWRGGEMICKWTRRKFNSFLGCGGLFLVAMESSPQPTNTPQKSGEGEQVEFTWTGPIAQLEPVRQIFEKHGIEPQEDREKGFWIFLFGAVLALRELVEIVVRVMCLLESGIVIDARGEQLRIITDVNRFPGTLLIITSSGSQTLRCYEGSDLTGLTAEVLKLLAKK